MGAAIVLRAPGLSTPALPPEVTLESLSLLLLLLLLRMLHPATAAVSNRDTRIVKGLNIEQPPVW